jgi:dTMP kinase
MVRRLVRGSRPDRYLRHLMVENWALAGIDVFHVAGTRRERGPSPPEVRALIVAIEGIDGSGKTTHAEEVVRRLEARGIPAAKRKIFRHGVFHETVTDLTRRCAKGRRLDLWRLQRVIKLFDSVKVRFGGLEEDLARDGVLVFDRYTSTHLAAGRGRIHYDFWARELMSVFPDADVNFLLDIPVECSVARLSEREARTVDENPYMLRRYREMLLSIAARRGDRVLDALAPFGTNADAIEQAVVTAWGSRS